MTAPQQLVGSLKASSSGPLKGAVTAPGDKSISHRALILGALAKGETRITGLLESDDVLRTAAAMRAFGAEVERDRAPSGPLWRVTGAEWQAPDRALYFGNSGTGARLVMGAAAGQRIAATFDGDGSLRRRPMERILDPLRRMGVNATDTDGTLPVALAPGPVLKGIDFTLLTPSAQIKSANLLAGLGADGETLIREPAPCRDHTERMLSAFGAAIEVASEGDGNVIRLTGRQRLQATTIAVPGDPSSAAFLVAAALIVPGSDVLIKNVLINPRRTGFYRTLREMGADIVFENEQIKGGEPVADIRARHSVLAGVEVPADRAPSMIDEYPVLAIVAAFAEGETMMRGIDELRVKESDRIAAVEAGLAVNGVATSSGPDWLRVVGRGAAGVKGGGQVDTDHDHRIAMSFLIMGLAARTPVEIDDASMIATSYPDFLATLVALGGNVAAT